MSEDLWYVKLTNGDVHRVTLDQLDGAFQAGQIDENVMVLGTEASEWMRLGDLLGGDEGGDAAPAPQVAAAAEPAPAAYTQPAAYAQPARAAYGYAQPAAHAQPAQAAYGYTQPAAYAQPAQAAYGYAQPAAYAQPPSMAPVATSLRPMSVDLGDTDLDASYPKRSKTPFMVAVLGCAAIAGAVGFVATRSKSSGDDIASMAAAAAMVAPHENALPPPVAVPTPSPLTAVASPTTQAPANAPPAEASPLNPHFTDRFNEDQKTKLLAADKQHDQKSKTRHGGGGAPHAASKAKSTTFTTGGNKYDPMNSSI